MGHGALIGIWSIAVNGFILHRAMNVTVFVGIFVRVLYGLACIRSVERRSESLAAKGIP